MNRRDFLSGLGAIPLLAVVSATDVNLKQPTYAVVTRPKHDSAIHGSSIAISGHWHGTGNPAASLIWSHADIDCYLPYKIGGTYV